MTALPKIKLNVSEFLDWWRDQPGDQRYELVDGVVVAMVPERLVHVRAKLAVTNSLAAAIARAGLGCEAVIDGVGVSMGANNYRLPDASVHCGELDPDSYLLNEPVILVEIVSPSSQERDLHAKLTEYFRLPSVHHYLVVYPDRRLVVHHRRIGGVDRFDTSLLSSGVIDLAPPGFSIPVEGLLGPPSTDA